MRHRLDLTRDHFDHVEFSESTLLFDPVRVLPSTLEVPVWGATILAGFPRWNPALVEPPWASGEARADVYIAGIAVLQLNGVRGGALEVSVYDPDDQRSFVRTTRGDSLKLTRLWHAEAAPDAHLYELECVLAWPHGWCSLRVEAVGEASLTWDSETCVSADAYVRDPERYRFKR